MADNNNKITLPPLGGGGSINPTSRSTTTTPKRPAAAKGNENMTPSSNNNNSNDGSVHALNNNNTTRMYTPQPFPSYANHTPAINSTNGKNTIKTPVDVNAGVSTPATTEVSTPFSSLPQRRLETLSTYNNNEDDKKIILPPLRRQRPLNPNAANFTPAQQSKKRLVESTSTSTATLPGHLCNALGQLEQSFDQVAELQNTLRVKQETIGELNEILQVSVKLVDEKEATVDKLKSVVTGKDATIAKLTLTSSRLEGDITRLEGDLTHLVDELSNMKVNEKTVVAIKDLENELKTAMTKIGNMFGFEDKLKEIESISQYITNKIDAQAEFAKKFSTVDKKVLIEVLAQQAIMCRRERHTLLALIKLTKEYEKDWDSAEKELSEVESKVAELEKKIETERAAAEAELDKERARVLDVEAELEKERAAHIRAKTQYEKERIDQDLIMTRYFGHPGIEQKFQVTKAELDKEKVRVSDLQAELENARKEAHDALTEAQANTSAVQAALNEAENKLENKSAVTEIDLAAERVRNDKLEAELDKKRKQSAVDRAKIAELEAKINEMSLADVEKAGESTVEKDGETENEESSSVEDDGDDKMAEVDVEEKTSAEPKGKLADVEMEEANEPANKSNDDDSAEPTTHHMTRRSKSRSKSLSDMDTVKPADVSTTNEEAEMSAVEKNVDGDAGKSEEYPKAIDESKFPTAYPKKSKQYQVADLQSELALVKAQQIDDGYLSDAELSGIDSDYDYEEEEENETLSRGRNRSRGATSSSRCASEPPPRRQTQTVVLTASDGRQVDIDAELGAMLSMVVAEGEDPLKGGVMELPVVTPEFYDLVKDLTGLESYKKGEALWDGNKCLVSGTRKEIIHFYLRDLIQMKTGITSCYVVGVPKCPKYDHCNAEVFTSGPGRLMSMNVTWKAIQEFSRAIPASNINYMNTLNLRLQQARRDCRRTTCTKHCEGIKPLEVDDNVAIIERVDQYCRDMNVPMLILGIGGRGMDPLFVKLDPLTLSAIIAPGGPHPSTTNSWYPNCVTAENAMVKVTSWINPISLMAQYFFTIIVPQSCTERGISDYISPPKSIMEVLEASDETVFVGRRKDKDAVSKAKVRISEQSQRANAARGVKTHHDYEGDTRTERHFKMLLEKSDADSKEHSLRVQPNSFIPKQKDKKGAHSGIVLVDCDACDMVGLKCYDAIQITNHLRNCSKGQVCSGCGKSDAFLRGCGLTNQALFNHRNNCKWNEKLKAIKDHVKVPGEKVECSTLGESLSAWVGVKLGYSSSQNCGMDWQKEEILKYVNKPVKSPCKCKRCRVPDKKKCNFCNKTLEKECFHYEEYKKGMNKTDRICIECKEKAKEEKKERKKKEKKKGKKKNSKRDNH